jgi:8-oxo-dGTP pyrophosphatase MutT (NUDIX family)
MDVCGKYITDEIREILNQRDRRVVSHLPFPRAAVLIPLFKKEKECSILFTKRTHQVRHHKGEISFPGGMFDEEDANLERTALREASEEIGLRRAMPEFSGPWTTSSLSPSSSSLPLSASSPTRTRSG